MTQSLQCTSRFSINAQTLDLSLSSQSPEDLIAAFEKDALSRADHLPTHQQSIYRSQVRACVSDLRSQLAFMGTLIHDSKQIRLDIGAKIDQYNRSLQDLYTHNIQFSTGQAHVEEQNRALARQLQTTNISLTPFVPKSRQRPTSIRGKMAESEENIAMRDHLLDLNIAANLVRGTAEVVVEAAKAACKVTETTELVCRSTLNFGKKAGIAVLEFTNTKECVKEAIRYWQSCEGSNLADILVERYGFAPDDAKQIAQQYVKDVGTIATGATAAGVTSVVVKVVKRLVKGVVGTTTAETTTTTVETAPTAPTFSATLRPVQPIVLNTEELTATRINQYADGRFYLPNLSQIEESSIQDLHKIWGHNQETLTGIIGEVPLPKFGFHGTGSRGVREILSTQTSFSKRQKATMRSFPHREDYISVAGYRYSVTPPAQLADLYSIVDYASEWLKHRGGLFVVETSEGLPWGVSIATEAPLRIALDTLKHRRFFNLMQRDGDSLLMTIGKNGRAAVSEEALLNAGEYHMSFTPENFDSVVRGVILEKDSLYKKIWNVAATHDKGILSKRFRAQETIMSAFEKLIVCEDFSSAQWEFYQKAGRRLLNLPKKDMSVPLQDFIRIEREFAQVDAAGKRFFSLYQKLSETSLAETLLTPSSPTINRMCIKAARVDTLDFKVLGDISLHAKEMVVELYQVTGKVGIKNAQQRVINQFKKFAKEKGAEKLYIEMKFNEDAELQRSFLERGSLYPFKPSSLMEVEFQEAIQKYPSVLRRSCATHRFWEDENAYLFEIPLS